MASKSDYEKYCEKLRSVEYDLDEIPGDYFTHETLLIKELFFAVFEENMSVEEAFRFLKQFYDVSLNGIKNRLIREGYIEESLDMDVLGEIIDSYNPKKLKKILKSNGLKVPKTLNEQKELIRSEIPEKIAPMELAVTEKAEEFWSENKNRAELFTDCCDGLFFYQEYYDVCMKNPESGDGENLCSFIDMHYDLAIERQDHQGMINSLESKGYYFNVHMNDFKKGCDELLREYILRVNPVHLKERYLSQYEPISYALNKNIIGIVDEVSPDFVLKRFSELWDEFEIDEPFLSYDEALSYLNQMFEDEDAFEKINKEFSKL